MSEYLDLARTIHVTAVVLWIGGVAFVTLVMLPVLGRLTDPAERGRWFHRIESRFAWQARAWVLLAGASGFWMIWRGDMWSLFTDPHFWWMHAMVALWSIFAVMLFVIEPLMSHFRDDLNDMSCTRFRLVLRAHQFLLASAIFTIVAAVAGSHGLL